MKPLTWTGVFYFLRKLFKYILQTGLMPAVALDLPKLEKHVQAISALTSHILVLYNRRKSNTLNDGEKEVFRYLVEEVAEAIILTKGDRRNGRRDLKILDLAKLNAMLQNEFNQLVNNRDKPDVLVYVQGVAETLASIHQTILKNRTGFWEST